MRYLFAFALAAILLSGSAPAGHAQAYGQYGGAVPLPVGGHMAGFYLNASDNVVGILAQLRLSFYPGIDFGFQGGLARTDLGSTDRTTLRLGTDLKGQVASVAAGAPVDVAIGGQLGVETGDSYDILRLGPNVVASHTAAFGQNGAFVPYASLGLLFTRLDTDLGDTSDFSIPLRMGGELHVMPEFRFVAELQVNMGDTINDNVEIVAGVNLPF